MGGILGGCTLLKTPQMTFLRLVAWLILVSTLIFLMSRRVTGWVRSRTARHAYREFSTWRGVIFQLLVSFYIGYFGAGAGILILAILALLGHGRDPYHERAKGVAHD